MGSFGERMQREREMRGISLEEIAESTKIGTRMLRALEQEEFSKLPGGIFNKGFVRAYARYLGIDEEQAVTDFVAAERESQAKSNVIPFSSGGSMETPPVAADAGPSDTHIMRSMAAAKERTEPQPDQGRGFLTAAVVVVLALGVGALAWRYIPNSRLAAPQPVAQQQPAPVQKQAGTAAAAPAASTGAAQQADSPTSATSTDTKPVITSASSTPALLTTAPQAAIVVDIKATGESWFKTKMDETSTEFTLSAGGTRQLTADKQITLTIGNASGVEISLNGKPLPAFAAGTKKKTLTFTPQGLQQ